MFSGKSFLAATFTVLLACAPQFAHANPLIEKLSACLADNTSGKDRKDLARWIFLSMAAHPEIRDLSNASQEDRDSSSRVTGQIFTRLVAENCAVHVKAFPKEDLPRAIVASFEALGRLAMQELMANKDVNGAISAIDRYVDREKLVKVMDGK